MDKPTRTIADQIVEEGDSLNNHDGMETNILPSTCADPEVLRNDNYAEWSARMKNCLIGQGLWDIVKTTMEPPTRDDNVVAFEAWKKNNDAALHAIQSSCGMDILSRINKISSAKIAWKMLGKMFMGSNDEGNSSSPDSVDSATWKMLGKMFMGSNDEGNSSSPDSVDSAAWKMLGKIFSKSNDEGNTSSSDSPGPQMEDDYEALRKAVRKGDWNATREFLHEHHPHALTAKILFMGGTVLHAVVDAEQEHIVVELVNMISKPNHLKLQDYGGCTTLHVASICGNYWMAECLITKNKSLVSMRNNDKQLPIILAMGSGHKELAHYLYSQTPSKDLEAENGCQGASVLNCSIYNRYLGTALDLMKKCPHLAFALDEENISPLEALAVATDAFESESNGLVFWKQWIYNHC